MNFKDMWLSNNRPRKSLAPKGVCIHWTANKNKGANAIANRNYFENHPNIYASAHYIVDDKYIVRCIPENEIAWHAGGSRYTELAKTKFNSHPNNYLIGIEMCVNSDSDWDKTYKNTVELVSDILKRYNWTINDIYRHFDCTKKDCPRMMTPYVSGGEEYFKQFKNDVYKLINGDDIVLADWQRKLGEDAVDELAKNNIIQNPEQWKEKLNEPVPNWLFFELIKRILNNK